VLDMPTPVNGGRNYGHDDANANESEHAPTTRSTHAMNP